MIFYLATRAHLYTITKHLASWGSALCELVTPIAYEDLFSQVADEAWWEIVRESWWPVPLEPHQRTGLVRGTYIFADLERLSPFDTARAAIVWNALADLGADARLLNHPTRSMRRYELLRTLYEDGINRFNVYRLTDARWPERYPVFIRDENDHRGARFPLMSTRAELEAALSRIDRHGRSREGVIAVEFCDTSDASGRFRKYGAFVVGGEVVPKNVLFNTDWVVKIGWGDLAEASVAAEEDAYIATNPHAAELAAIARRARIAYGRIDYGLLEGRVQVWEINTNPMITHEAADAGPTRDGVVTAFSQKLDAALRDVATTGVGQS